MKYKLLVPVSILWTVALFALQSGPANSQPNPSPLVGVWQAVTYQFQGNDQPMEGILIFTERHFAATVRFRVSGGALPDLNATTGTYRTADGKVIFVREIAASIRSGDREHPLQYSPGERQDEVATYRIKSGVLTISFPSGNRYVARRLNVDETGGERKIEPEEKRGE